MTERQKEILEVIKTLTKEKGYAPTIREIMVRANLKSTGTVHTHIKKLKAKGYLTSGEDMPRSIVVANQEKEVKFIVNAIVKKQVKDKEYILLEEECHKSDFKLGLPGGTIKECENVYGVLRRELNERGLNVTKILDEEVRENFKGEEDRVFEPFCISQNYKGNDMIITNTFVCEASNNNIKATNNYRWVYRGDLDNLIEVYKHNISGHNLSALRKFISCIN